MDRGASQATPRSPRGGLTARRRLHEAHAIAVGELQFRLHREVDVLVLGVDQLAEVIDLVDLVLIMSVNPGFGGQAFIPSSLTKVANVREMIDASGREIRLEIDGGIKADNIADAARAGADTCVVGSAIFSAGPDYAATIARMREALAAA